MKVIVGQHQKIIHCQGCGHAHGFGARWSFNGDLENPTFKPSHVHHGANGRCHINVTDGRITFHPDCEHKLRGQTLPLEDFDEA